MLTEEMQTVKKKKACDNICLGKPKFMFYKSKISSISPPLSPNTMLCAIQVCNVNCGLSNK